MEYYVVLKVKKQKKQYRFLQFGNKESFDKWLTGDNKKNHTVCMKGKSLERTEKFLERKQKTTKR